MTSVPDDLPRCSWAAGSSRAMVLYHDTEWGVPTHDDRELFELLVLEGAQAGLSWRTILERRDGYRRAFAGFEPRHVAALGDDDVEVLLTDPGIIRNRAKVRSAIRNAAAFVEVVAEAGTFDRYLWSFVDDRPVFNHWTEPGQVPAITELGEALSKDLHKRGFTFVGPTIMYAYAQSAGLVMDHLTTCHRFGELSAPR
ncbi:MAG: DNA-3-methyladenine glycosylase I [Actinomycetota bacterium]|nr:DNA-3-methyladenine glycosylase I [Actinomycetota bacterium]